MTYNVGNQVARNAEIPATLQTLYRQIRGCDEMKDITDPQHNVIGRDGHKMLYPGENPGKWDEETGEYRKIDKGNFYYSFSGLIYNPLTLEQAQLRGIDTFSE